MNLRKVMRHKDINFFRRAKLMTMFLEVPNLREKI